MRKIEEEDVAQNVKKVSSCRATLCIIYIYIVVRIQDTLYIVRRFA